jgi:dolichol-phosphate mannosyltransferase
MQIQKNTQKKISIIIPLYNEEKNIPLIHAEVLRVFKSIENYSYEIIFVDDGSKDNSSQVALNLCSQDSDTFLIQFSRNFGKEAATSAGIHNAKGDAVICIDADLQHPPSYINEFITKWEEGHDVVIGVRSNNASDTLVKKIGSYIYYKIVNKISETKIIPSATDFRLLDRGVVDDFNLLNEKNRMTRALIDWLGYKRTTLKFIVPERIHGAPAYSFIKLVKLAMESFISHSLFPLRLTGYVGLVTMPLSGLLLLIMFIDRYFHYFHFNFSGPAILANVVMFLVSILLISIGLLSYYIGHMHQESQNRPLYVIRKKGSRINK